MDKTAQRWVVQSSRFKVQRLVLPLLNLEPRTLNLELTGAAVRILLVEDNRRLSYSLKASLLEEGYAVDVAYDGEQGEELGLAQVEPYDAIILDVMLPRK